jgi:hypothetical protein
MTSDGRARVEAEARAREQAREQAAKAKPGEEEMAF